VRRGRGRGVGGERRRGECGRRCDEACRHCGTGSGLGAGREIGRKQW